MLVQGKKALIFGVANDKSIAYAIAKELKDNGAAIALSYAGEALKKRVEPIHEELGSDFLFQCDVSSDEAIAQSVDIVRPLKRSRINGSASMGSKSPTITSIIFSGRRR